MRFRRVGIFVVRLAPLVLAGDGDVNRSGTATYEPPRVVGKIETHAVPKERSYGISAGAPSSLAGCPWPADGPIALFWAQNDW